MRKLHEHKINVTELVVEKCGEAMPTDFTGPKLLSLSSQRPHIEWLAFILAQGFPNFH